MFKEDNRSKANRRRFYGVAVSTEDFKSFRLGSTPSRTSPFLFLFLFYFNHKLFLISNITQTIILIKHFCQFIIQFKVQIYK